LAVPDYGVGAGLRIPHYRAVLENQVDMGFFEVISENFFGGGGKPLYHLDRFCERYPIILHGVALSIGAPEPPAKEYLNKLKALVKRVKPAWVSDHFCYCGAGGAHLHDLLPLPYTDEAVRRVAERAKMVQDFLEVPFGLENTSSYLTYTQSTMTEWEFVRQVVERADCGLMFDVNNVYVSAYNHGYDPLEFIRAVPHERILQIHIAGHTNYGKYIIDTHVGPLIDPVLDLYRETIRLAGPISTLLEWDDHIPEFSELQAEVARVAQVRETGLEPNCPAIVGDVVVRTSQVSEEKPTGAWAQGGPSESLQSWEEAPQVDPLRAERETGA
jgi:uncharacterized protein (UPF0276 family)